MMIRANHVTLLRIILLPIPCYLMFGGFTEKVIALLIFALLGLTDYLDGYLARKQGITTLGTLLDPIADKIFITAIYIPFVRMEIVPLWMVLLLFAREYTVVELRSICAAAGTILRTTELARYKTNIQMMGAGFIFLIEISGKSSYVFIPLGGCLLFAVIPGVLSWIRVKRTGARTATAIMLVGAVLCARLLLPPQAAIRFIMAVIVAITIASGIQYVTMGWAQLRLYLAKKFGVKEWTSFLGMALIFPILYVSLSQSRTLPTWIVISILSFEFAAGGLSNLLLALRIRKDYIQSPWKILFQNCMGAQALILSVHNLPGYRPLISLTMWTVLAVTFIHCLRQFYVHRTHFTTP